MLEQALPRQERRCCLGAVANCATACLFTRKYPSRHSQASEMHQSSARLHNEEVLLCRLSLLKQSTPQKALRLANRAPKHALPKARPSICEEY